MVTVNNYYNNIPVGRDLNNLPNTSSAGTTVGYQYDGLTEEDRFVQKVFCKNSWLSSNITFFASF